MEIIGTTTHAAAQVIDILVTAQLRLAAAFAVHPLRSPTLPITFTMLVALTAPQVWMHFPAAVVNHIAGDCHATLHHNWGDISCVSRA